MSAVVLAAPTSGSGKTTITLGVLRALTRRGLPVRAAKVGPDYIDTRFHAAATRGLCVSLDTWAMQPGRIADLTSARGRPALIADQSVTGGYLPSDRMDVQAAGPLVIEGAMGLFDGAVTRAPSPEGLAPGSTADLARRLGASVVLVVDAARMGQSIAALVAGYRTFHDEVPLAGVILNRVGSDRHEGILRDALHSLGVDILGAVPRLPDLAHPSRHLGLVQAHERPDLEAFLDRAADLAEAHLDLDALVELSHGHDAPAALPQPAPHAPIRPPSQSIAIASDEAFSFAYPHILNDWRQAGASIRFFSPLQDEAVPEADLVFLPGGYPELHAGRLAASLNFLDSLQKATQRSVIYGECGGFMVLGNVLVDAEGKTHRMAGLLHLETSFATRKLHLGYRQLTAEAGAFPGRWRGHEFHYATTLRAEGEPLFQARDAAGERLEPMGLVRGSVSGSFAHLIDAEPAPALTDDGGEAT